MSVRARGQGWRPPGLPPEVAVMNLDPAIVPVLPISLPVTGTGSVAVSVRVTVPSRLAGNGIGRPAAAWDLDL
jgi:hypothetical protein